MNSRAVLLHYLVVIERLEQAIEAIKANAAKARQSARPRRFKRAMRAAKSIAYSRTGASGIIAVKLMERLGIAEQLTDPTKLVNGVPVAEAVAKSEAEIGIQQINVILPVAVADHVGSLPFTPQLGIVASLKRPSGNMTGIKQCQFHILEAKRLEILLDDKPFMRVLSGRVSACLRNNLAT
jgi:hypothetical protein